MRRWLATGERRTAAGATVDQAAVSLGNFLTNIVLARHLAPRVFGAYAVIYGLVVVANAAQLAVIGLPMCIKAAGDRPATSRYASHAALLTVAIFPLLGLVVFGVGTWLEGIQTAGAAALALLAWQLQETFRRALMANLRYAASAAGNAISYLGQAALLFWLAQTDRLSLTAVFLTIAATSMAAMLLQAALVGVSRLDAGDLQESARQFWALGGWMLIGTIANNLGTQFYPWTLAAAIGAGEAAKYQAAVTLVAVTHPLMFSLPNLITPAAAAARSQGLAAVRRLTWKYTVQFVGLASPYFLLVAAVPATVLGWFYGHNSPYGTLGPAVRVLVLAYVVQFIWSGLTGMLNGLEEARASSMAQVIGLVVIVAAGVPLCIAAGVIGAAITAVLAALVRLLALYRAARQLREAPQAASL